MKAYTAPRLIEYGRIDQLTLGTASAIPDFPPGNAVSPTLTEGGALYVLDATAGVLWRATP